MAHPDKNKSGVFVTGTDTDVGKSVASAWLVRRLDGCYWKPVQSGLAGESDTAMVARLSGLPVERFYPSRHRLQAPRSPHEAARKEGVVIGLGDFRLPDAPGPVVVEGAGGVLVPLNQEAFMVDLMGQLGLPVVLVCRTALGTINHTLLSLEALRSRGVTVAGVILNGAPDPENRQAIASFGRVAILADIPHLPQLDEHTLGQIVPACGDWRQRLFSQPLAEQGDF